MSFPKTIFNGCQPLFPDNRKTKVREVLNEFSIGQEIPVVTIAKHFKYIEKSRYWISKTAIDESKNEVSQVDIQYDSKSKKYTLKSVLLKNSNPRAPKIPIEGQKFAIYDNKCF